MTEAQLAALESDVAALLGDYLTEVSRSAHRLLGEVAGVAVTLAVTSGTGTAEPVTAGASTQLARDVDDWQYQIGRGPCLTALSGGGGCYVPDLGSDPRWGDYGPGAAALGARSCLSAPILLEETPRAVLKVYSGAVDGLDAEQRATGVRFAAEVVGGIRLALTLGRTSAELQDRTEAMDSRRTIDLALGVLMERTGCDPDTAFDLLRRYSQQRNVKVRELAAELVAELSAGGGLDPQGASEVPVGPGPAPFRPRGAEPLA